MKALDNRYMPVNTLNPIGERIVPSNSRGQLAVHAYFESPHGGRSITACLYPRDGNGYIFEVSPQDGCPVGCDFCGCDRFRGNLSADQVISQIDYLSGFIENGAVSASGPWQVSFTDGGELVLNQNCPEIVEAVLGVLENPIIKVSTILPDNLMARRNLSWLVDFMREGRGRIDLQVSFHSTDSDVRSRISSGARLFSLADIRVLAEAFRGVHPESRCVTLSFTLTDDSVCDPVQIAGMLSPDLVVIKLHPYKENGIGLSPISDQRVEDIASRFRELGYFVIAEHYDDIQSGSLLNGGTLMSPTD